MTTDLYSPDDLAEKFGVSTRRILEWRLAHGWPCVKVGKRIRFTEQHVEQIIAMQSIRASKPKPSAPVALPGQTARSAAKRRSA